MTEMESFTQCRLVDVEGWTTVRWVETYLAKQGAAYRVKGRKYQISIAYQPAILFEKAKVN